MTQLTDFYNFGDDTIFHACDSSLEDLVNRLEHDANLAIECFDCHYMKLSEDKCNLIISGQQSEAKLGKNWSDKNIGKQKPKAIGSYN